MQRSLASRRPDQRLVIMTIAVLCALLVNLFWAPVSGATGSSPSDPDVTVEPSDIGSEPAPVNSDGLEISVGNFCSGEFVTVILANTGSATAEAIVSVNGAETAVSVPSGATKRVFTNAVEDTTYDIVVTSVTGSVLFTDSVLRDCQPPAEPTATIAASCADGGALVTLTGDSNVAQTVDVLLDGAAYETVTIPAGETVTLVVPMDEDQTATISVLGPDASVLAESTITLNCSEPSPEVSVTDSCVEGGAVVTVSNTATISQIIDVLVDGTVVESTSVPAGSSVTVVIPMDEDQTSVITVRGEDGSVLNESTVTHDCFEPEIPSPEVAIAAECDEGGAVVTITNPADVAQTVSVKANGAVVETISVPAAATVTVTVPMDEDDVLNVSVEDADGVTIADADVELDCSVPNPIVLFEVSCANGSKVTIQNPADVDQVVEIRNGLDLLATVTVPAGATLEQPLDLAEDQPAELTVVLNGEVVAKDTLTVNCISDDPLVETSIVCETNQVTVQVTNVTPNPITVTVTIGNPVAGTPMVEEIVIDGDQSVTRTVVAEEGATTVVTAVVNDVTVSETTLVDDCTEPVEKAPILSATLTHSCSSSVATASLSNIGDAEGTFTITLNGTTSSVTVAPGVVELFTFAVTEDASYTVVIADGNGNQLLSSAFTYNCKPDVNVRPRVELPRTGSDGLYTLVLSGLFLLCLGMLALDMSRKNDDIL